MCESPFKLRPSVQPLAADHAYYACFHLLTAIFLQKLVADQALSMRILKEAARPHARVPQVN